MSQKKADYRTQVANPERAQVQHDAAVLAAQAAVDRDPDNAGLWTALGLALSSEGLMREAVEAYSHSITLDPFNGVTYRHRGHRHLSCWEFPEATADFATAARLLPAHHPEMWNTLYHLGLSYYLQGEYQRADAVYAHCYAITDPADASAIYAITDWSWRTLMRLGKKDVAAALVAKLTPDFDVEADECGYSRDCAMYQGRIRPEDLCRGRMQQERLDAITMIYCLSNYYFVTGEPEKSNEVLDEALRFGKENWWCGFGYLAAMQDKKARAAR